MCTRQAAQRTAPPGLPLRVHTHQPQVLHGLREHALVQLQLADLHDLHASDRVASWEEDPGRKRRTHGVSSSHLCSQHAIRSPGEGGRPWLDTLGPPRKSAVRAGAGCGAGGTDSRDDGAGMSNKHRRRNTRWHLCVSSWAGVGGGETRCDLTVRLSGRFSTWNTGAEDGHLVQTESTNHERSRLPTEMLPCPPFPCKALGIPVVRFIMAHLSCGTCVFITSLDDRAGSRGPICVCHNVLPEDLHTH